jgi:hypothetical protein
VVTACDCGADYVSAGKYAAIAVAKNPEMSDRAIAAATGIPHKTVSRARQKSTVSNDTVGRTGLDGRTRKPPKPRGPLVGR